MFTITGTYRGRPAGIRWDGEAHAVSGFGKDAVAQAEAYVEAGVHVGMGPWRGEASLSDEQFARITLLNVLDDGAVIEGDELPDDGSPTDDPDWVS